MKPKHREQIIALSVAFSSFRTHYRGLSWDSFVCDFSFKGIEESIVSEGGKIVDLDEPKLTHIVLDKRDVSRRKELMKRTSKPKRRNLVLSDFVQACIEESSLLDEEGKLFL